MELTLTNTGKAAGHAVCGLREVRPLEVTLGLRCLLDNQAELPSGQLLAAS